MSEAKDVTHRDVINRVIEATSVVSLMGWAALGKEYAGSHDCLNCPSGFDFSNVAMVVERLLLDVCGDLETLKERYREVRNAVN